MSIIKYGMYDVWERQGLLMTTEGNVVHYGYIEKFIENLGDHFNIREIALDRAIRCGNDNAASVYDERGILFI